MWLDKLLHQYLESKGLTLCSVRFVQLAEKNSKELEYLQKQLIEQRKSLELFKKLEKDSKLKIHILEAEKVFLKKKLRDKCHTLDILIFFFFSFLALTVLFINFSQ